MSDSRGITNYKIDNQQKQEVGDTKPIGQFQSRIDYFIDAVTAGSNQIYNNVLGGWLVGFVDDKSHISIYYVGNILYRTNADLQVNTKI